MLPNLFLDFYFLEEAKALALKLEKEKKDLQDYLEKDARYGSIIKWDVLKVEGGGRLIC